MELVKHTTVDQIEVKSDGCVQVRAATVVTEGETVIGRSFHRHVVVPGADYSGEDSRVQAICATTHTTEVIAAYKAAQAAQGV